MYRIFINRSNIVCRYILSNYRVCSLTALMPRIGLHDFFYPFGIFIDAVRTVYVRFDNRIIIVECLL